jgi:hypothetical protein
VKVERIRPNVFTLTAAGPEISALVAGARMARDQLRTDPHAPREAVVLLERVLADYDRALARIGDSPESSAASDSS